MALPKKINPDRVREVLNYDAETGVFTWKLPISRRADVGEVAGGKNKSGYILIQFDGKQFYAHRLAWAYIHGCVPDLIDHINGDKSDNRFCNLREASKSQNGANQTTKCRAKSGEKGVYYQSNTKKWRVKVGKIHVGYFDTKNDAHAAYAITRKAVYGEFAKVA